jgi:hypothetical protein
MIRLISILLAAACIAHAADSDRIKVDASVLASIPAMRHAAVTLFAITYRDSGPAISEKKAKYIEAIRSLIRDLLDAYYWHTEFPKDIDAAIEKRAVYEAGLQYPASPTTGATFYGDLVQRYTIRMYEEEIVTIAFAVSERFGESDIVITDGKAQDFKTWKKEWDDAGNVKDGPNQPPEPASTALRAG